MAAWRRKMGITPLALASSVPSTGVIRDDNLRTPKCVDNLRTPKGVIRDDNLRTPKGVIRDDNLRTPKGVIRDDNLRTPYLKTPRTPKGYLPLLLVRDDDEEGGAAETRVFVRVRDLKEPCMAALLETAEEQFGYSQQGVLKVPCDAQRFDHVVNLAHSPKSYSRGR